MACTITKARKVDCRDALGGLKKIFIANDYMDDVLVKATLNNSDANQIDDFGQSVTVLEYALRPDLSSMTINVTNDATGAAMFEQTLNVVLKKIQVQDAIALQELGKNRSQIFVLDNNDRVYLLGATEGMNLTGGSVASGAARTEGTTLTLDFSGSEPMPFYTLKPTAGPGSGGTPTTDYPFDGMTDGAADFTITVQS